MKYYLSSLCVAVVAVLAVQAAPLQANQHSSTDEAAHLATLLETIQQLQAQISELQAQLAAQRSAVRAVQTEIRTALREGMRSEEVRQVQELLASDPEIYPEGLVTGYYGPLTRQAIERFQERHRVPAVGMVDDDTRALINQYFAERTDRADAPGGLLRAPGIQEAVERRVCARGAGTRPFCPAPELELDRDPRPDPGVSDEADDDVLRACGLDEFAAFRGQAVDRAAIMAAWEAHHGQAPDGRAIRILGEGDPMTMDYREDRVNVILDDDDVVIDIFCG